MIEPFVKHITLNSNDNLPSLIGELEKNNYRNEANALNEFMKKNEPLFVSDANPWTSGVCYIGNRPPMEAKNNDVWFDAVELTPFILVSPMNSWIALHPVYTWQYKAFLQAVRFEFILQEAGNKKFSDFLNKASDRLKSLKDTDFVTNIFNEEARAYVTWMGKGLLGEDLHLLEEEIDPLWLNKIAPQEINLWDWPAHPGNEMIRLAFNLNTAKYEFLDELETLSESQRALFGVFETSIYTGFTSLFPFSEGLITPSIPYEVGDYIRLLNTAKR